ncbi:MAG: hypothetical protein LBP56_07505 [Odoribacteraceae bacterium]|jgi:hypothetical protein|nr:hypothetical protein [Odoribacteraceae bacterium]
MKRQILLPVAVARELRETFKVDRGILRRSLCYERNGPQARLLRAAALERGGVVFTGEPAPRGYCPPVETSYEKDVITRSFGDRVELRVERSTETATVVVDGAPVARFRRVTLDETGCILYSLEKIHDRLSAPGEGGEGERDGDVASTTRLPS